MTSDTLSSTEAALAVMSAHLEALNARDETALAATLHFPHFRLAGTTMKIWPDATQYLADFFARAGDSWSYTRWGSLEVISSASDKVHIRARVDRFRADDSLLSRFESLWVISRIDGVWAAQLRSSFAAH